MVFFSSCSIQIHLLNNTANSVTAITDLRPAADALYGQANFSSNAGAELSLSAPTRPVISGGKLFLVDNNDHRILIWNSIPTSSTQSPNVIVGQAEPYLFSINGTLDNPLFAGPSAKGLGLIYGLCVYGTHLVATDYTNNRILIWNSIPTTNLQAADVVLGQPDFTSNVANNGGIGAATLKTPMELDCSSGKLYASDNGNHRILFWNSIPTTNFQAADGVLGQPNFISGTPNNGGRSGSSLSAPRGIGITGTQFMVADEANNRVLVWNTPAPASLQAANYALGQTLLTTAVANNGGLSGHSLSLPSSLDVAGNGIYVSDFGNSRILVWDNTPANSATDADRAIGQPNLTSNTANNGGISAQSLAGAWGSATDGTKLVVADYSNARLLIYNTLPTTSFPAADVVWGQSSMSTQTSNGGGNPNTTLARPFGLSGDGSHFWVADQRNNRVLRWPLGHTPVDGSAPDLVLGQMTMGTNDLGTTSTTLSSPSSVASDGTHVYVADYFNNRILVWNTYPTTNGVAADAVIGQPSFITSSANNGGISGSSISLPYGVTISNGKLFLAEYGNNRVLIWNSLPSANTPADVVLGQPGFLTNSVNNGGISASSLANPSCVLVYGTKLFVCDRMNNRVLIWNSIPTVSNTPADIVVGQADFLTTTMDAGQATVNALGLKQPLGVAYAGNHLYVTDYGNSRILVWNSLPTTPGTPANQVYGQLDFVSSFLNSQGLSAKSLLLPFSLLLDGPDLWVNDYGNNRLIQYDGVDR
jgi:hypothetical protein